jgi:hypothetical protein
LGNLNQDPACGHRHRDDGCDDRDHQHRKDKEVECPNRPGADELEGLADAWPDALDDREEDHQARAVAQSSLGDLLAEPHDEDRAGGEKEGHLQAEGKARPLDNTRQRLRE